MMDQSKRFEVLAIMFDRVGIETTQTQEGALCDCGAPAVIIANLKGQAVELCSICSMDEFFAYVNVYSR